MFCMNCKRVINSNEDYTYCPYCQDRLDSQDENIDWGEGCAIKPKGWRPFPSKTKEELVKEQEKNEWGY